MDMELSVILPAYNEAAIIKHSLQDLILALETFKKSWEIIVVNDGSTDDTALIVSSVATEDSRVKLINYERNRGRGYALRRGFDLSKGNYVVTIESDGSWGTQIVFDLYEAIIGQYADVVVASPFKRGGAMLNVPWSRKLPSRLGNIVLQLAVSNRLTTLSGMTRIYRGETIRSLQLYEDGKEIHLEILSRAFAENLVVGEIPAQVRWPDERKIKTANKGRSIKLFSLIVSHLFFGFSEAPVLLFGPLAVLCLISGVGIGFFLAYLYLVMGMVVGGRIVLIMTSVFLIITGLQFFIICFLAYQAKATQNSLYQLQDANYRILRRLSRKVEERSSEVD